MIIERSISKSIKMALYISRSTGLYHVVPYVQLVFEPEFNNLSIQIGWVDRWVAIELYKNIRPF